MFYGAPAIKYIRNLYTYARFKVQDSRRDIGEHNRLSSYKNKNIHNFYEIQIEAISKINDSIKLKKWKMLLRFYYAPNFISFREK